MKRLIDKIIVHCSDSAWGDVDVVRDWHVNGNGWSDVGYNCLVLNGYRKNSRDFDESADGLIELGRPLERVPSHCYGHNKTSLGICLIGIDIFTPKQYYSLRQILDVWRQLYSVEMEAIGGHRDYQQRPGKTCPNFDVRSFYLGESNG